MKLNDFGRIVENTWFDLVNHVRNIKLHAFIVMPNHIHGLIEIYNDIPVGAGSKPVRNNTPNDEPAPTEHGKTKSISEIVRQFKTFSSRHINKSRNAPGNSVWQRNYHEHVVRNDNSYLKISGYIINNPAHWRRDKYFV
ncbi:transposase [candidate division KSB1 bacterium]|nr:transposase [candidate division KSB1 bacterium]